MKHLCAALCLIAASGAAFAQQPPRHYIVSAMSGSGQVAVLPAAGGAVQFAPLVARVTDAANRPMSNVRVVFYCGPGKPAEMTCMLDPTGTTAQVGFTGSDGMVVLNRYNGASAVAANATGKMPIIASSPDPRYAVLFDLTVVPAPVATVSPPVSPPGATR